MPVTVLSTCLRRLGTRVRARLAADRRDRGGIAPVVAVLLTSGVLLGMAALVVDVGAMYAEREQLQTGADAAAVKVAQVCATSEAECTAPSADDVADAYARDNARAGRAGAVVCGRGGALPECPAPSGSPADCLGSAPASGNYVEVHTHTEQADGSTVLPPVFANAVIGGFDGPSVTACARVGWGAPSRAYGLALTISVCDWRLATGEGTVYPTTERAIALHDETGATACGVAGTGSANRGGFRWLDGADGGCRAMTSAGGAYAVEPADTLPAECPADLTGLLDGPRPVPVPVFGSVTVGAGGGAASYRVLGFAAFVLTGWQMPGSSYPSDTRSTCDDGATTCVFGYFTRALVGAGAAAGGGNGALGGPDLGASVVSLIG